MIASQNDTDLLHDYTKLLIEFKSIPQHKRARTFMEISGYPHYENVCSNILAFYLNPSNEHALKDLVLNSLMHSVEKDFAFDFGFEDIEIDREHRTSKDKRLDIVILTEKYAIGIENKVFHYLHNDLSDYYETIKSFCNNNGRKPICIVLSLNELASQDDRKKITDNHFINITYEQIFQNIKKNIGKYLTSSNISYVNHLTDFIKSIENLTSRTMDNKALWLFFKNHSKTMQELTDSFDKYKNDLYEKVNQLKDAIPQNEFAPTVDKQWIYRKNYFVHDYTINSKYKLAIDTLIDINTGWEIQILGRNDSSTEFIFNTMLKDSDFLPKNYVWVEKYESQRRLIYQKFDTDTDISDIAKVLTDLLARIENYKKRTDINS